MELNKNNIEVYAARHYTNESCLSKSEFLEDLEKRISVRRMTKRFASEKSTNIRLFLNHVIGFVNNFEVESAKKILLFDLNEDETSVLNTVFNYLGYTVPGEVKKFHLFTAKSLKEMDR